MEPEVTTEKVEGEPEPEATTEKSEDEPEPETTTKNAEDEPMPEATTEKAEDEPESKLTTDKVEDVREPEATAETAEAEKENHAKENIEVVEDKIEKAEASAVASEPENDNYSEQVDDSLENAGGEEENEEDENSENSQNPVEKIAVEALGSSQVAEDTEVWVCSSIVVVSSHFMSCFNQTFNQLMFDCLSSCEILREFYFSETFFQRTLMLHSLGAMQNEPLTWLQKINQLLV